jgi:hypothetical protein
MHFFFSPSCKTNLVRTRDAEIIFSQDIYKQNCFQNVKKNRRMVSLLRFAIGSDMLTDGSRLKL